MSELFLSVLNRSIAAGWLVPMVLVLRLILKKAPKWVHVLLWGMVGIRAVCPITVESMLSLIPSAETVSPGILTESVPVINSGVSAVDQAVNTVISGGIAQAPAIETNPLRTWIPVLAGVWIAGMVVLLAYTAATWLRLWVLVREAVRYRDNIYQSEQAASAFVLGLWKPRIYLPYGMGRQDMPHVIAHEQAHIRRGDPWWKLLGFLALTVHWFNPLLWLGYILFCRDLELACDESVIRKLGNGERADYSQALLACSVGRRGVAPCPLAFGEVGVKQRIRSVLGYKRPTAVLVVTAVILCLAAAVCFLTNPTAGTGVGIRSMKLAEYGNDTVLEMNYFILEKSGFHSRAVPAEEGEYTGDGMVEYDGALGKYRILILFGDTEPSESFRRQYPVGEVVTLGSFSKRFRGTLKCKVVYPQDHGFAIYIGCDEPFVHKEAWVYNDNYLWGTLKFELFNVEEPDFEMP